MICLNSYMSVYRSGQKYKPMFKVNHDVVSRILGHFVTIHVEELYRVTHQIVTNLPLT